MKYLGTTDQIFAVIEDNVDDDSNSIEWDSVKRNLVKIGTPMRVISYIEEDLLNRPFIDSRGRIEYSHWWQKELERIMKAQEE